MGLQTDKKWVMQSINDRVNQLKKYEENNKTVIQGENKPPYLTKYERSDKMIIQGEINIHQKIYEKTIFYKVSSEKVSFYSVVFKECLFDSYIFRKDFFVQCEFDSCYFLNCVFDDVRFENCKFVSDFHGEGCIFESANFISSSFEHCYLYGSGFKDDTFNGVVFTESNMQFTRFGFCGFSDCKFDRTELEHAKFLEMKEFSVFLEKSLLSRDTIFHCSEKIVMRELSLSELTRLSSKYRERSNTYAQISKIFKELGATDISGEYYYLAKKNEGKAHGVIKRLSSFFADILCGYGERPSHTFICIILNILLFGIFYLINGFAVSDRLIDWSSVRAAWPNIAEIIKLYCHSIFFSITTFSTVGYGNYVPAGAKSSSLAAIQMLMGVSLTALWTGSIFRKISR